MRVNLNHADLIVLLGQLMSEASEQCWCAGWLMGTEELLPAACRDIVAGNVKFEPNKFVFGYETLPFDDAQLMCSIADQLGHWVDFDNKPYIPKCDKDSAHGD